MCTEFLMMSPTFLDGGRKMNAKRFVRFYESSFGRKILRKEANYLRKELKGRKKVLDIGCGAGFFEAALPEFDIIGLDSSKEMLMEARKRSDKKFVLGSAEQMSFPDKSFDAAFAVTTLEFLDDYRKAVKEISRVLRSNGKFVAMILNTKSKYFRSRAERADSYFRLARHRDAKQIEHYISKFFTTKSEYFLGILGTKVFDTRDKNLASLYVIKGENYNKSDTRHSP